MGFISFTFLLWSLCRVHMAMQIVNLHFESSNFQPLLLWDSVEAAGPIYYVQFKMYGFSVWENKTDCQGTLQTWCNFTSEMSKSEDEYHQARVRVVTANSSSSWKETKLFHPFHNTNIDPPMMVLTHTSNSITVNVTVPKYIQERKYAMNNKMKYLVNVSYKSQVLFSEYTTDNVWKKTDLSPGLEYCVSVLIEFSYGNKRSNPSPTQCVLGDTVHNNIILGSIVAALVILMIVSIILISLVLRLHVLNPKARLPSNLSFQGLESKTSIHREYERVFEPSTFESMGLTKYVLEAKAKENPHDKRYISTEPWKKDYVNCKLKETDHSTLPCKSIEVRNLMYGISAPESSFTRETLSKSMPCIFQQVKIFTEPLKILDYSAVAENVKYFNEKIMYGELCLSKQPYINQERILNIYVNRNDASPSYLV